MVVSVIGAVLLTNEIWENPFPERSVRIEWRECTQLPSSGYGFHGNKKFAICVFVLIVYRRISLEPKFPSNQEETKRNQTNPDSPRTNEAKVSFHYRIQLIFYHIRRYSWNNWSLFSRLVPGACIHMRAVLFENWSPSQRNKFVGKQVGTSSELLSFHALFNCVLLCHKITR